MWSHGPTEGQPVLREAIADRFRVPAESVLVLAGAQQGLDLLARCLVDPGDAVIMDRPGYLGAIQSFRAAGAKLIGWDVARAGGSPSYSPSPDGCAAWTCLSRCYGKPGNGKCLSC